jgi:hypothetical protein
MSTTDFTATVPSSPLSLALIGRHFLQIPGPTNVSGRTLQAIAMSPP